MANIAFSSLKLKTVSDTVKIKIGEKDIEIKKYLPAKEKNEILESTVQQADLGSVVNTFAIDCFFHLYIVMYYTNIIFTDKQKEDMLALYDILETNNVIDEVIKNIPDEYNELKSALDDILEKYAVYRNSVRASLDQLSIFAPQQMKEMSEAINGMNVGNLNNIVELADNLGFNVKKEE